MAHRWLILGAGGHGRSVADAIRAQGDVLLGFLDDSRPAGELVAGVPVIGALSLAQEFKALPWCEGKPAPDRCVVAIGHPSPPPALAAGARCLRRSPSAAGVSRGCTGAWLVPQADARKRAECAL